MLRSPIKLYKPIGLLKALYIILMLMNIKLDAIFKLKLIFLPRSITYKLFCKEALKASFFFKRGKGNYGRVVRFISIITT
ncbi:hypothetical protein LB504_007199 [Fusarium proliferatum]|nr:hypothetical protein LB504_007199 [Fusarium proliferatum]